MVWSTTSETVRGRGDVKRLSFVQDKVPLTNGQVLALWRDDGDFVELFCDLLGEPAFDAYFFEMPALTEARLGRRFECVLVNAPILRLQSQDDNAFAEPFAERGDALAVGFDNLGGDAFLVVPTPTSPHADYTHLASFCRTAPFAQQCALWRLVSVSVTERLGDRPLWLSTSGLGVAYLHIRVDQRPKYITFKPYRATG